MKCLFFWLADQSVFSFSLLPLLSKFFGAWSRKLHSSLLCNHVMACHSACISYTALSSSTSNCQSSEWVSSFSILLSVLHKQAFGAPLRWQVQDLLQLFSLSEIHRLYFTLLMVIYSIYLFSCGESTALGLKFNLIIMLSLRFRRFKFTQTT